MKRALNGFSDITNGLMDFTKTVDYSKSELEKASVERKDKIAKLHRKIQEQGRTQLGLDCYLSPLIG